MILAKIDFGDEVWRLVSVAVAVLQPVLVIVLCAMFVLAAAHLLTMFGTRWGNKRVSGKAFLFSIGVHLALACGIIALWPEVVHSYFLRSDADEQEERIRIEQIIVETPLEVPRDEGDTPVWEQLPETRPAGWERTPAELSMDPEVTPTRPDTPEFAALAAPEQTPLPLEDAAVPVAADTTPQGRVEPAAVPLETPQAPTPVREDVQAPPTLRERSQAMAVETPQSDSPERPRAGQVQRLSPDVQPDATSVAGAEEEQATLARTDEAAEVMRREGPAPSTLDVEQLGAQVEQPGPSPEASGSSRPRIARERTSTPRSTGEGGVERFRPETAPQQSDDESTDPTQSMLAATPGDLPELERPALENAGGAETTVPAPYRMRTREQRDQATQQFGGTAESEQAVAASLAWLAANQHPNGYWDADQHGAGQASRGQDGIERENAGRYSDTGVTGLAVLAFLAPGNTPGAGEYSDNVARALRWLISQQAASGAIAGGNREGDVAFMYCHAIATFALAEAYAIDSSAEWLKQPVEKAVRYTLSAQLADGGWRYGRYRAEENVDGDMSIFGWQLMSLKSAELAGIPIPSAAREKMIQFLIDRSLGHSGGLASYRLQAQDRVTPAMTAEALFCKQMLGMSPDNSASAEAVEYLRRYPPHRAQANFYYWYYGTLAMFQYGGGDDPARREAWESWNETLRDLLVVDQRKSGPLAGSWDPNGLWGGYGGRVYTTAVATLCLEVYYRYHLVSRERQGIEPPSAP